jgi:hypothetical protein
MARPPKFNAERAKRVTDALTAGVTRKVAAQYAGVDPTTLCRWLKRYADFAAQVTLVEAQAEVSAVATIRAAAKSDWRAAAWWLERRRDDWNKVDRLEVEIRDAAEKVAAVTGADAGWLVKRAGEIADAAARERSE